MQDEEIMNLSDIEFDQIAKSQSVECPDLLKLLEPEEIIKEFYSFYNRKYRIFPQKDIEEEL